MTAENSKNIAELLNLPEVKMASGNVSPAIIDRRNHLPERCEAFKHAYSALRDVEGFTFEIDPEARQQLPEIIDNQVQDVMGLDELGDLEKRNYQRPRKIGIVFSGGPAPGGHNVIAGLFDAAKAANPQNTIYGFLMGPDGIIEGQYIEITAELVDQYRNLGGFGMIKTGRTKIDTEEKMKLARQTCKQMALDALVVVGGDDSNTNAAFLAQELKRDGIQVIGVPKTIDGDVQVRDAKGNILCAMSFGFHTAARGFAQEISNLCNDCSSDVKYWHICKVMGRVASHLALEVALQTHANMTLIGEDIANYVDEERLAKAREEGSTDFHAYGLTLRHLSRVICDGIVRRAAAGKNYGVLVIPEGVLEFINEIQMFIIKLNTIIAEYNMTHDRDFHTRFPLLENKLDYLRRLGRGYVTGKVASVWNLRDEELFGDLPEFFQEGLLTERDSHGNFQFSQVKTETVLMGLVRDYLRILREEGKYKMGIDEDYYRRTLKQDGLDPEYYGAAMFENFGEKMLHVKRNIISIKTLKQALVRAGVIASAEEIPAPVKKIYLKSVPNFKTQVHFYGYDGRGGDPTKFDCTYTYNLGLTVFALIANGATGQMAAIKNLEHAFAHWKPISIPIAPLMHLEERKGKLALVLERSLVDLDSLAFRVVEANREHWLAALPGADNYRNPGRINFAGSSEEDRPLTLMLNALTRPDPSA